MKLLLISALFPPDGKGGAEDCAFSFAEWATREGHEVLVVTAANGAGDAHRYQSAAGYDIVKIQTSHVYPVAVFPSAPAYQKPLWHLQDHFASAACRPLRQIVDTFQPDIAMVHMVQGLGYRILDILAERRVPTAFVLHDLGLACIRMSMFKHGKNCQSQCAACTLSGRFKASRLEQFRGKAPLGFISPSRANIETLSRFVPLKTFPNAAILNTKSYPSPTTAHQPSRSLRLLYAGKLEPPKGVDLLAQTVEALAVSHDISLSVAGAGSLSEPLLHRFQQQPWFKYLGFLSQQELADAMEGADFLCVPSLWEENSPGVVVHALSIGVPVIGNDRGGIAELVNHDGNGILVPATEMRDWSATLAELSCDHDRIRRLRAGAVTSRERFDIDAIGNSTIQFMESLIAGSK